MVLTQQSERETHKALLLHTSIWAGENVYSKPSFEIYNP